MKKIIAFAGSNSKDSINKQLVAYASGLLKEVNTKVLDLNDFPLPFYGIDEETKNGIPAYAKEFLATIKDADGIMLSLAEHNGSYTVAFKNLYDWMSRIEKKVWSDKPMLLLATSPGGRGGANVLATAQNGFPHMGGNIVSDFSLPKFFDNFSGGKIVEETLNNQLIKKVNEFVKEL